MAGNSANINLWKDAEVWFSLEEDAKVAADGTFGADWMHVGLLNDGSSLGQERDADRNEIKSWGGKLQITDQKFNKDSRTFETIEDNETTFKLMWPNSTYAPTGSTVLKVPQDAVGVIAFKTTNQKGEVLIDVSRKTANVYPSNQDKNDDGASTTEFTAEIMADDTDSLYDRLRLAKGETPVVEPDVIRIEGATPPAGG